MLTTEQLKSRKRGIGESDAAAVCGVSKWRTPVDVYLDKTSLNIESTTSASAQRGHTLEPLVRALFVQQTGKQVQQQAKMLKHDKYQFMLANIDGYLVEEKALFEAKTSSYQAHGLWGPPMTDQIPDDYFCQVQHYMAVTNTLVTYVSVLLGDDHMLRTLAAFVRLNGVNAVLNSGLEFDFRTYVIKRDDHFIDRMIKIEGNFWINNIVMGIAPEYTTTHDLKALFPSACSDKHVIAPDEAFDIVAQRKEIKHKTDILEDQMKELDAKLMSLMGDAEALVDGQGKRLVSWKNIIRRMFDTTKFKAEMPDLYHQFSKTSTSRTFRI